MVDRPAVDAVTEALSKAPPRKFPESVEHRASRIGGVLLFGLAAYVVASAAFGLWVRQGQEFSTRGLVLALLAVALSAWVKWKPAAGGLMFGVFFVAAGFGATINGVQRTNWGHLFNISALIGVGPAMAFGTSAS